MNKDLVPYKQSLQLKELGFDEPCFTWYWDDIGLYSGLEFGNHNKNINYVSAPTFSQALRFFREKHNLYGFITSAEKKDTKIRFSFHIVDNWSVNEIFDTPEEAELACLIKLIEIVTNK